MYFKVLSLTYNSLQYYQPNNLRELLTIQPSYSTRPSSVLTILQSPITSHLKFSNQVISLEYSSLIAYLVYTSTTIIANHKPLSSSGSSLSITPGFPLKTKLIVPYMYINISTSTIITSI